MRWLDRWCLFCGYEPHSGQLPFHADTRRFRVMPKGRRGGGTTAGAVEAEVELQLWAGRPAECTVGIVAPSVKKTELLFGMVWDSLVIRGRLGQGAIKRATFAPQDRRIVTAWGSNVIAASLKEGLPFEGWGLRLLIVDESQELPQKVWEESLAPTLMETGGRVVFIGKAKGTYFRKLAKNTQVWPDRWGLHHFTSAANPVVPEDEIEIWRQQLPHWKFQQEVMAEFQDMGDQVFRGIEDVVDDSLTIPGVPIPGGSYSDGWDLGRKADETAGYTLSAHEKPYTMVDAWAGLREPWPAQQGRITERQKRWDSDVWLDATGLGDVVLGNLGVPYGRICNDGKGYIFTPRSKEELITNLQRLIENGEIRIPSDPKLIGQLEDYRWDDWELETDRVMGLALAALGCEKSVRIRARYV